MSEILSALRLGLSGADWDGQFGRGQVQYVIEGARIEQRSPSANFCELIAVCARYSLD
jgi:hypothetical protein